MFLLSRHRTLRRLAVAAATLGVVPALTVMSPPAQAATPFNVIGTADVFDSFLIQNVIKPGFEAQYPQYTLNYTSKGTGDALNMAKAGGFSATIVHSASLENQWVAAGYSLEPYGRAIMWGDYVLLGPASDPAGVLSGDSHDVVGAFEKIAAAGAAGHATFVSRGTTAGTVTQEHKLWSLTTGVTTCTETSANGGGSAPNLSGGACPANMDTTDYPNWYEVTDAAQAANVQAADTCPISGAHPNGNCYVLTDRGTFQYLESQGALHTLTTVTRNNDPSSRGGRDALINVFHAYAVNPAAPGVAAGSVDPTAAKLFLDYLTSPAAQAAIGKYLNGTNDPPFIPAAAPELTTSLKGDQVRQGRNAKIKGTLSNQVPGYPALGGVTVNLLQTKSSSPLAIPKIVASAVTTAAGSYVIKHKLKAGKFYQVGVGPITKVERTDVSPAFGDILTATSTTLGGASGVKIEEVKTSSGGGFSLTGRAKPGVAHSRVVLMAAKRGHQLKKVATAKVRASGKPFSLHGTLGPGSWTVELVYAPKGDLASSSRPETVRLS